VSGGIGAAAGAVAAGVAPERRVLGFFPFSESERNTHPDWDADVTSAGTSNEGVVGLRERATA
jgi:hypothetical protein